VKQDIILILNLGGEENLRVARIKGDLGVYSEIHPEDIIPAMIRRMILNGGRNNMADGAAYANIVVA